MNMTFNEGQKPMNIQYRSGQVKKVSMAQMENTLEKQKCHQYPQNIQ